MSLVRASAQAVAGRRSLVLRHSSRAAHVAGFDRYSAIRTFFAQPARVAPAFPAHLAPRPSPLFARWTGELLHARRFHLTRVVRTADTPKDPHPQDAEVHKPPLPPANYENYSPLFRRLAQSLPHISRPTRDDFLNAATGFGQRMRVRIRWSFIRASRKFNADDISAFITWFLMSQGLWILIGTTTFFSVVFAIANSLQVNIARALSDYLTAETGVTIIFESAIVPKWKDSRISFKNVYITRRPSGTHAPLPTSAHHALGYDVSNHPANHAIEEEEDKTQDRPSSEDDNWAMFDLSVDSIDVTLSLWRWLDGKGLVKDAVVKGVRGVLDRRSVYWSDDLDPASFRHVPQPGDFELESLTLEDLLITIYQPGGFRPYTFSIFRADVGILRKQWIFYDFMKSEGVVGQFDNCLFSLHRPQSIGRTNEQDTKDGQWSTMSRFRIDGVNIDHLQAMTTQEGPLSWITSGKLDAVLDIKFPRNPDADGDALDVILDALTTTAAAVVAERIPGQRALAKPPLTAPDQVQGADSACVVLDIDLRLRDLKAAVPIWTNDLSYSSNALIRPIVAFMNANRTLVPIRCRVVKEMVHFDGSWTMWETGLMDDISLKVYEAFAYHVTQANFNHRIKTVSLWSLQMTAGAVLTALRNVVDPVAVQVRDLYQDVITTGQLGEIVAVPL
ncbi:hypothetical protein FA95DRAFT_1562481 [Auriscalpium vulgare]|uniref:Uncharacterized protein n=1 Tax=Auriscalpium vulgare TaxID=40419 RepID=A0ACB8RJB3_9AGAM|nr:hypothetical protein FA95DRAFT_1562481 [Auriscalpium vulgare]